MELIIRLWKNFKVQPEIWFFYGFLLTFTLTIRKVLWFLPLRGEFNEYSGIYLYLSDIFLGLAIMAWIITILYNKIDILSIFKNTFKKESSTQAEMFHACPVAKKCSTWNISFATGVEQFQNLRGGTLLYILLPLALVVWSFISLIWAENKIVAIFRSVKILEFYLLYFFVLVRLFYWNTNNNVPHRTLLNKIFGLIMIIGLFQAIIGITQFILQHSIGLFWLKESLISPNIDGVAKVILNGETFVRAYGLFPHPNILGGFLIFSIFISWHYYKSFNSYSVVENCSTPACRQAGGTFYGAGVEQFIKISLGIQLLALILTFSKSAILGLILGLTYHTYINVPRGTFINFIIKRKRLVVVVGLVVIFTFFILKPDWHSLFVKSLDERTVYVNVSRGTIWGNPILGIGSGQFVISMENLSVIKENWMLEPVHNVFLLVWSELGLVGILTLALFIFYVLRNVPHGTSSELVKTFGSIFIGLLFIMFFDHYLWDIQQGSFLLWMTMGFLVGAGERKDTI
jgi:hypothetical protein